ncbi:MAG: phosphoglucomutase/phosphomannomutase family protein [Nitrospirae bacterium]|nr:MAG: phosphoglucomutase/phosphomannomutase family protein [Nitrospirota bacterium]
MATIKFGTSGWRAILADEFTFSNVRIVTQGIAQYLRQEKIGQLGVIVGYDSRFLGELFARTAAEVLAAHGIPAFLCDRETPTPTIAYHVVKHQLAGGINISASHNPPEYNGVKFTPSWGGPALPETTRAIEQRIQPLLHGEHIKWLPWERAQADGLVRWYDPRPEYLTALEGLIDCQRIRERGLRIVMDPFYGTTRGYLDEFLRRYAGAKLAVLHHWRDPYFGGGRPDPSAQTLRELRETVRQEKAHLGVATDGDGDRFGVVDADGTFIEPNVILALVLDYLVAHRKWKGGIARSVATTHLIDLVAAYHGLTVYETPVGFKYIGELLAKGAVILGGEESAGLSIQGHVPEKDGMLACALVTEMVAVTGKTIQELVMDLYHRVGRVWTRREDLPITSRMRELLDQKLEHPPSSLAGMEVVDVNRLDGCKLILSDGSWFLLRPSGTEPIVRCYGEAKTAEQLERIMRAGRTWLCET